MGTLKLQIQILQDAHEETLMANVVQSTRHMENRPTPVPQTEIENVMSLDLFPICVI